MNRQIQNTARPHQTVNTTFTRKQHIANIINWIDLGHVRHLAAGARVADPARVRRGLAPEQTADRVEPVR